MLILDRLLAAPVHGLLWVARKIQQQAEQEMGDDEAGIRRRLAELNRQLDTGVIDLQTFTQQEAALLDRLDAVWARQDFASMGNDETGGRHD